MSTYSDKEPVELLHGWRTLPEMKQEWQEQARNQLLNEVDDALRDPELYQRLDLGPEHMRVVERMRVYIAGSFSSEERSS